MLPRVFLLSTILLISTLILHSTSHAGEGGHLSGDWKGDWRSHTNGHHGPMKAEFEKINRCQYEVVFRGRFAKVIPFRYKTTLNVVGTSCHGVKLAASHRLGPIMGTFHCQATATRSHFTAHYYSRHDNGQFNLHR